MQIERKRTPEEEELDRKLAELAALEAQVAERELELATLRAELAAFERRYQSQVGARYAELEELLAEIAAPEAQSQGENEEPEVDDDPNEEASDENGPTTRTAEQPERASDFHSSEDLKRLFRKAAKAMHPDLAEDEDDRMRRHRFMAQANRAYEEGDESGLQAILDEWRESAEAVRGAGADLVRIIRKIAKMQERLQAIEDETKVARKSDFFRLKTRAEEAARAGRDLLQEMAAQADEVLDGVRRWRHGAEQGDAEAQFMIARCLWQHWPVEAVAKWWRKAAEGGYAEAQYNLGVCYELGEGVERNLEEAVKWYRRAAEQGDADAQFNVASCCARGEGVQKDEVEAAKWYREAAQQGHARAQVVLAWCYEHGAGVAKDSAAAIGSYREAAKQGNAVAQVNLGHAYESGKQVKRDLRKAVKWYGKAAEQGNADAQYNLGCCYRNGIGVAKDFTEAMEWYRKAAEHLNTERLLARLFRDRSGTTSAEPERGRIRWKL